MAKCITYLLIHYFFIGETHPFFNMMGRYLLHFINVCYLWTHWWLHLIFLIALYYIGKVLTDAFRFLLLPFDIEFIQTSHTRFRSQPNSSPLLTLDGRLYVFTNIINIFSHSLAYLWRSLWSFKNYCGNCFIIFWNKSRTRLRNFPLFGWPLQVTMTIFAIMTTMCLVIHGYYHCLIKVFQKPFCLLCKLTSKIPSPRVDPMKSAFQNINPIIILKFLTPIEIQLL